MWDDIEPYVIVFGGIILFVFMLVIFVQEINIKFIENIHTVCLVDGKKIYEGPSVGISVDSSGANTTVNVKGGFLYLFPKAYYVSKDVKLVAK